MTERDYTEPSNEQLANFLAVYARNSPGVLGHIGQSVNPVILERILEANPEYRAQGLRLHREFQEQINELSRMLQAGELQCEHIRPNGKKCPNYNQPGSSFCGLHTVQESE